MDATNGQDGVIAKAPLMPNQPKAIPLPGNKCQHCGEDVYVTNHGIWLHTATGASFCRKVPDQPSKESLERARKWLYQSKNVAYSSARADESLALEFDAIARELRQQNATLVSALRVMLRWALYGQDCDYWYFTEEQAPGFSSDVQRAKEILAPYAPAEEAQGKPVSGTEEK